MNGVYNIIAVTMTENIASPTGSELSAAGSKVSPASKKVTRSKSTSQPLLSYFTGIIFWNTLAKLRLKEKASRQKQIK